MNQQITVDGLQLELNLSVNYFYRYFLQITGKDLLLDSRLDDATGVKAFDYAAAFIAAGHQAWAKVEKKDPKITHEQLDDRINSLPLDEAAKIVVEMVQMISGDADPNGKPQVRKRKTGSLGKS